MKYAVLILSAVSVAAAQLVEPYPISSCDQGIGFGFATCPNQPGCCSGAAICCAGGCCPTLAFCVNVGTADEGCCPIDSPDNCGAPLPPSPTCTAANPGPSKWCSTADEGWYCEPGATCGTYEGSCFNIFNTGGDCEEENPESESEPEPTPSESGETSVAPSDGPAASDNAARRPGTERLGGWWWWPLVLAASLI